jgi:hypothetical protein
MPSRTVAGGSLSMARVTFTPGPRSPLDVGS